MENLKESVMRINELLANNPKGLTVNEISEGMGVNRNTVAKYLEVMVEMCYQSTGYRRVKNPRIWSMHDIAVLTDFAPLRG